MLPNLSGMRLGGTPRCLPCEPTDKVVDYESEGQLRSEGATRLFKGCPENLPDCMERQKVPWDQVELEEFSKGKEVMILGCGHAFKIRTVQNWNIGKATATCPLRGLHQGQDEDGNYFLNEDEQSEINWQPTADDDENNDESDDDDDDGIAEVVHEGEGANRRLVRIEWQDYGVYHYEGVRNEESLVRIERLDGSVEHFEGEKDQERLVRTEWPDGTVEHFEGGKGREHLVVSRLPDGSVEHYEGEKDQERLVRTEWPDGRMEYFEGGKDREHLVVNMLPDGIVQYYEGEKDRERLVSTEWPDGRMETHAAWKK